MTAAAASPKLFYAFSGNNLPDLMNVTQESFHTKKAALDRCDEYLTAKIGQFYAL